MKAALLKGMVFFVFVLLFWAQPVLAKTNGFYYVMCYSLQQKVAYFSPVIIQKVDGISYNSEEFVNDVALTRRLESQFSNHLSQTVHLDIDRYAIAARGAFKSDAIAGKRLNTEMNEYKARGYTIKTVSDFVLTN